MKFRLVAAVVALAALCTACVDIDYNLGGNLVPGNQMFTIHTADIPVTEFALQSPDSLTGYSSRRITIGAVRDNVFGLSTRSCALALVPMNPKMDFGENPEFVSFHFSSELDTVSVENASQECILQNIRVYELTRPIRTGADHGGLEDQPHGTTSIVRGSPVINGSDSLSFDFTEEYGRRFLTLTDEEKSDYSKYIQKFPGIYIETEAPAGMGGRINIFKLQFDYDSSNGYFLGNYAILQTRGTYDGVVKDSLFCFFLGADNFYKSDSLLTNSATGIFPQYALNIQRCTTRETPRIEGDILVEGGGAPKPVVSATYLRDIVRSAIKAEIRKEMPDISPAELEDLASKAVVNKATLILPYEVPERFDAFAEVLSPTVRYTTDNSAIFMNITDAASSDENQGDINLGTRSYRPDITYHLQAILDQSADQPVSSNYDVWLLIKKYETLTTNASTQSINDYYQQLAYQNYYYQMYGYGGSGSYGYNDYYSNYYYWSAMNSSASTSSTQTQLLLDQDRYYRTVLNGAEADRHPMLELTYSLPID